VVFYFPDSAQLHTLRQQMDTATLGATLHEFEYLIKNARRAMRENPAVKGIPSWDVTHARYLLFRGQKGDSCIDLDSRGDLVGIFLFKTSGWPRAADLANIDSEFTAYYSAN
jgi:hypothetical protein